jgi:hypothetical protein
MLDWKFWANDFDELNWAAYSAIHDDGTPFEWVIFVNDAGLFSVEKSSAELTDRKESFETLAAAKAWCQEVEDAAIEEARKAAVSTLSTPAALGAIIGSIPYVVRNTGNKYWDGQEVYILECPYPGKCRVRSRESGDITWVDADYLVTPSF